MIVRLCSNIPSNLGTVLGRGLTKLLLEVALLEQDNSAMHSDKEREEQETRFGFHMRVEHCLDCRMAAFKGAATKTKPECSTVDQILQSKQV